ncbi:MAG: beta-glucosidase [Propionibacteriaceae bacterium]|jgi:beta-glucosidase|nr:beta-glucosidase [Propionibacteriaceae bacterium]
MRKFPDGFTWGTATASYQVEGAIHEDGRVPSIWDTMCATPGKIKDGTSGAFACDQYHRYKQDIALMKELGVSSYRFSTAWPRIIPSTGKVNQSGVDHYSRLVDALLEAGIKPTLTLYHWDLPQYLEDAGGWPERDTAYRFAEYAEVMGKALGDRVDTWTTLNEPWCAAFLGYADGEHAPGRQDHPASLAAAHHLNLAHGLALQALGAVLESFRSSVTLNLHAVYPASKSGEDIAAAERIKRVGNEIWLGPMLEGAYDPQLLADTSHISDWAFIQDGDLAVIRQPISVLGLNYYSTTAVQAADHPQYSGWAGAWPGAEMVEFLPRPGALTAMGWDQTPSALTEMLTELSARYPGLELMVTENGSAWDDLVSNDGLVHDPDRVAFLKAHVEAVGQAIDKGAPVSGYFAWSLLDNFEWAWGLSKRFGIIRVDYDTQERIWKDSGRAYQRIATTGILD